MKSKSEVSPMCAEGMSLQPGVIRRSLAVFFAGIILTGCATTGGGGSDAFTVLGSISVPIRSSDGTFGIDKAGERCESDKTIKDKIPLMVPGKGVVLRDFEGNLLGRSELRAGSRAFGFARGQPQIDELISPGLFYIAFKPDKCVFEFAIREVSSDDETLFLQVVGLPEVLQVSQAEARAGRIDFMLYRTGSRVVVVEESRDNDDLFLIYRYWD
jgi:hypothetical protein